MENSPVLASVPHVNRPCVSPQLHPAQPSLQELMKVTQTELGHFASVGGVGAVAGQGGQEGRKPPETGVTMAVTVKRTHLINDTWNFFPLS